MEKSNSIADLMALFAKWRQVLVKNFIIFTVLGATISLILPKWYTSTAVVVPTVQSGGFNLASALNPFLSQSFGFTPSEPQVLTYLGILQSRYVHESAIKEFNLIEIWRCKNIDDALETMPEHTETGIDNNGLIYVESTEKDPQLAADIANFFVDKLQEVNVQLSTQSAKANREFLEARVNEMTKALNSAEDTLRAFQEKNGAYSIPEQVQAMITSAATLQANIYALEVEVQVMENSVNKDHPELLNKKLELAEMKKKLRTMENAADPSDLAEFQIPFNKLPKVGVEYFRLMRDVEKFGAILEFLVPQLENAKLEEIKNTPTIQVLDRAVPAEQKSKPVRSVLTLVIVFMGMTATIIYIAIVENMLRMKTVNEKSYNTIIESKNAIMKDAMRMLTFWKKQRKGN